MTTYDGVRVVNLGVASLRVKSVGIDAAQKKAQLLEKKIRGPALKAAMREMLKVYRKGLVARLPNKKSGKLRRSIRVSVRFIGGSRITGKLSIGGRKGVAPYAYMLEKGTGIYGPKHHVIHIKPKRGRAIMWPGAPHPFARAQQKGIKPLRFLETTGRVEAAPAARAFEQEFHRQIGKPFK